MKNKIIFGSLLVVTMLIMLPSISAVQFNNVKDAIKTNYIDKIQNISLENLEEKIKDNSDISQSYDVLSKGVYGRIFNLIKRVILSKLFGNIFGNVGRSKIFSGSFGKLTGIIAIPIIITICSIFGISLTAILGVSIPLIYLFAKTISMMYGTIFGLSTQALKSILLIAILRLF